MKPGQPNSNNKQRSRGRGGSNNGGGKKHVPLRNQTFDSNGPDIRVRGNAHQVLEKYLALARDAASQGDRIMAENYYQHAEHYFRVIQAQNQQNGGQNNGQRRPISTPADDHAPIDGDDEVEAQGGDEAQDESPAESGDEEPGRGGEPEAPAQAVNA